MVTTIKPGIAGSHTWCCAYDIGSCTHGSPSCMITKEIGTFRCTRTGPYLGRMSWKQHLHVIEQASDSSSSPLRSAMLLSEMPSKPMLSKLILDGTSSNAEACRHVLPTPALVAKRNKPCSVIE